MLAKVVVVVDVVTLARVVVLVVVGVPTTSVTKGDESAVFVCPAACTSKVKVPVGPDPEVVTVKVEVQVPESQ